MDLKWYPDADEPVVIVLAGDTAVAAANPEPELPKGEKRTGPTLLQRYMQGLVDVSELNVPPEAIRWTVRPLTVMEVSACRRDAGAPPMGDPQVDPEIAHRMASWMGRYHYHAALRGLVDVGHPAWAQAGKRAAAFFEGLRPKHLAAELVVELGGHIARLSNLSPEGKARFAVPAGATSSSGTATAAPASGA